MQEPNSEKERRSLAAFKSTDLTVSVTHRVLDFRQYIDFLFFLGISSIITGK